MIGIWMNKQMWARMARWKGVLSPVMDRVGNGAKVKGIRLPFLFPIVIDLYMPPLWFPRGQSLHEILQCFSMRTLILTSVGRVWAGHGLKISYNEWPWAFLARFYGVGTFLNGILMFICAIYPVFEGFPSKWVHVAIIIWYSFCAHGEAVRQNRWETTVLHSLCITYLGGGWGLEGGKTGVVLYVSHFMGHWVFITVGKPHALFDSS